jgi:hypothetical protein
MCGTVLQSAVGAQTLMLEQTSHFETRCVISLGNAFSSFHFFTALAEASGAIPVLIVNGRKNRNSRTTSESMGLS